MKVVGSNLKKCWPKHENPDILFLVITYAIGAVPELITIDLNSLKVIPYPFEENVLADSTTPVPTLNTTIELTVEIT